MLHRHANFWVNSAFDLRPTNVAAVLIASVSIIARLSKQSFNLQLSTFGEDESMVFVTPGLQDTGVKLQRYDGNSRGNFGDRFTTYFIHTLPQC